MKKLLTSLFLFLGLLFTSIPSQAEGLLDPVTKTVYYGYLVTVLGFYPEIAADAVLHSETVEGIELYIYSLTGVEIELPHL